MAFSPAPRRMAALPLAAALMAGAAMPAYALDGDAFADKLNEAYAAHSGKIEYASAVADGDTVTLTEARFTAPGQSDTVLGDMVFSGVEETDGGGYTVENLAVDAIEHTSDKTHVTVSEVEMEGLVIPADSTGTGFESMMVYDTFSTGEIKVAVNDKNVFSLEGTDVELSRKPDDAGIDYSMTGSGLSIDITQIEEPKVRDMLAGLGYDKLTGDISIEGAWETAPGRVYLDSYSLKLDDVGELTVKLDISGYTMDYLKSMQESQQAAAEGSDGKQLQQALHAARMDRVGQLTFNSGSLSFKDASLTRRALELAGQKQGVSGEQMGDVVKAMLPLALGRLNMPELQQQLAAAASAFIDNPRNVTITAQPETPVSFSEIMGAGMGDPRQLVDLLGVKITANQ